jgi:hypothetical protein
VISCSKIDCPPHEPIEGSLNCNQTVCTLTCPASNTTEQPLVSTCRIEGSTAVWDDPPGFDCSGKDHPFETFGIHSFILISDNSHFHQLLQMWLLTTLAVSTIPAALISKCIRTLHAALLLLTHPISDTQANVSQSFEATKLCSSTSPNEPVVARSRSRVVSMPSVHSVSIGRP